MDYSELARALRVARMISAEDYAVALESASVFSAPMAEAREISDTTARHIASATYRDSQSPGGIFYRTGEIAGDYSQLYCELFPVNYGEADALTRLYSNVMGTYLLTRQREGRTAAIDGWAGLRVKHPA